MSFSNCIFQEINIINIINIIIIIFTESKFLKGQFEGENCCSKKSHLSG